MEREQSEPVLGNISTLWALVEQAHGEGEGAASARSELLRRYGPAVLRYLRAAVGTPDADELFQDFSLRFLEGRLRRADPARGRFRDFVKGVLSHLIADHHTRKR